MAHRCADRLPRPPVNVGIQDMSQALAAARLIMFSELVDVTRWGSLQRVMGPALFESLAALQAVFLVA